MIFEKATLRNLGSENILALSFVRLSPITELMRAANTLDPSWLRCSPSQLMWFQLIMSWLSTIFIPVFEHTDFNTLLVSSRNLALQSSLNGTETTCHSVSGKRFLLASMVSHRGRFTWLKVFDKTMLLVLVFMKTLIVSVDRLDKNLFNTT